MRPTSASATPDRPARRPDPGPGRLLPAGRPAPPRHRGRRPPLRPLPTDHDRPGIGQRGRTARLLRGQGRAHHGLRPQQRDRRRPAHSAIRRRPPQQAAGAFDVLPGESNGGGYEIRTREGLPPTRFPSVRPRPLGESSAANNTRRWRVLANTFAEDRPERGRAAVRSSFGGVGGWTGGGGDPLRWASAPHVALSD